MRPSPSILRASATVALFGALLAACLGADKHVAVISVSSEFALTSQQKAECPALPNFVSMLKGRLIVEGLEATPCDLKVTTANGVLSVAGICENIPIGQARQMTLLWYAKSKTGIEITLAESIGVADLTNADPTQGTLAIPFDPVMQPATTPKTSAVTGEAESVRNVYNCDRTGTNFCDSTMTPPSTPFDTDTCSNLEELCQNTLFDAAGNAINSIDKCPTGPGVCKSCPTCLSCN